MTLVRGAFNELLRPGLKAAWEEAYGYAERRTGISEVQMGVEPRPGVSRRPLYETEPYPPTDWPDYP